jgi:hypothetical protein
LQSCESGKIVGQTHHMLVSLWGKRWSDARLVFSFFIDDSGTSPSQHVAIATALIIPASQLLRLESEWETFRAKEQFECFHTSEFVHRNPKSEFAKWDDAKQDRVFRRVRQIALKYGSRAVSIAVNKKDYDEVVPMDVRSQLGKDHYSWAVRQLLVNLGELFPPTAAHPREFVFQWMERKNPVRKEIEGIMDLMQFVSEKEGTPGDYSDPHFRKSVGIPGLQCVDAVSWVSYQYSVYLFRKTPLKRFVPESWQEFGGHLGNNGWLQALTLRRESLERSVKKIVATPNSLDIFRQWQEDGSK